MVNNIKSTFGRMSSQKLRKRRKKGSQPSEFDIDSEEDKNFSKYRPENIIDIVMDVSKLKKKI